MRGLLWEEIINVGAVGSKTHVTVYIRGVRPDLGKVYAQAIVGRNNKLKYCFFLQLIFIEVKSIAGM